MHRIGVSASRFLEVASAVVVLMVVGVGVAGILSVYTTSIKNSADPLVRKQALAIAESLLEEILLKDYCDPDTATLSTTVPPAPPICPASRIAADQEASRANYDDVDDYRGYVTTGGNVESRRGAAICRPNIGCGYDAMTFDIYIEHTNIGYSGPFEFAL